MRPDTITRYQERIVPALEAANRQRDSAVMSRACAERWMPKADDPAWKAHCDHLRMRAAQAEEHARCLFGLVEEIV